jgi:polynucleotide 5'-hydroxyl-kinase GRC3/NOL9
MEIANIKPISAIAAAKLRSQPQPIDTGYFNDTRDDTPSSPATAPGSSNPAFQACEDAISDEELPDFRPNVQMCNWSYGVKNVAEDTRRGLTVSMQGGEDIALIGVFDFIVLKGAININGANFAAVQPLPQNALAQRVYVPSTHPISLIKALDDSNMIQFLHCDDTPKSFASISPLFAGIWYERSSGLTSRSFGLVSISAIVSSYRATDISLL